MKLPFKIYTSRRFGFQVTLFVFLSIITSSVGTPGASALLNSSLAYAGETSEAVGAQKRKEREWSDTGARETGARDTENASAESTDSENTDFGTVDTVIVDSENDSSEEPDFENVTVSLEEAEMIYNLFRDEPSLASYVPDSGCDVRAWIMCAMASEAGFPCGTIRAKKLDRDAEGLSLVPVNRSSIAIPMDIFDWDWHEAPYIKVRMPDGSVVPYILDPSTAQKPCTIDDWLDGISYSKDDPRMRWYFDNPYEMRNFVDYISEMDMYLPKSIQEGNERKMVLNKVREIFGSLTSPSELEAISKNVLIIDHAQIHMVLDGDTLTVETFCKDIVAKTNLFYSNLSSQSGLVQSLMNHLEQIEKTVNFDPQESAQEKLLIYAILEALVEPGGDRRILLERFYRFLFITVVQDLDKDSYNELKETAMPIYDKYLFEWGEV